MDGGDIVKLTTSVSRCQVSNALYCQNVMLVLRKMIMFHENLVLSLQSKGESNNRLRDQNMDSFIKTEIIVKFSDLRTLELTHSQV